MTSFIHRWTETIRRGKPIPLPMAALLTAVTPLMRAGMWLRLRRPSIRVEAAEGGIRVISFGNLTAGGTGKTPAVIERARIEMEAGRKVAVLTRGYGARQQRAPVLVDTSARRGDLYEVLGDEPALIARKLPGIVIAKCADRVAAARAAIEQYQCNALILDDGFQAVALARDENVVLIDATNPFGNGRLIPRGILREPLGALRRATAIILTRCDQASALQVLLGRLKESVPNVPIRKTRHAPKALWHVADDTYRSLDTLRRQTIRAACAIAHPDAFFQTLEDLGAVIADRTVLPDHYQIPATELAGTDTVVVTEKDAVRMKTARPDILALCVELEDCP